uniref:Tryptophan 2-monooxygenase n=2 Tax=Rhizobiaceae TaxID=82115 RepID=Q0MXW3_RHIRH|nr:FAD-dependent oxidoreductase [Rhizobium rhizogenes]ABI15642.1 trytophan 2-monooxygenase [Rhizobium rhizogenes]
MAGSSFTLPSTGSAPLDMMLIDDSDLLQLGLQQVFSKRYTETPQSRYKLTRRASPDVSSGEGNVHALAFIYVNAETLQMIKNARSLTEANGVKDLVAIDVPPFRNDFSRALLLQVINLLGNNRNADDDLSHFIAVALPNSARSKILTTAPFEGSLSENFRGFPITREGNVACEVLAYGNNLMPKACSDSFPTVDLLYDYGKFFESCAADGRIGYFPEGVSKPKVAIIGAGISGLVAASELLHAGVDDVTVYEASDRLGGKLWSHGFKSAPNVIAEMGAMRFPRSESCLFFYLKKHGLDSVGLFPNPGSVDTALFYRGRQYIWKAGEEPPELFRRVHHGWRAFLQDGYLHDGVMLASPLAIVDALKLGHLQQAHGFWQSWLTYFERESFSSGIEKMFLGNHPPGGEQWNSLDDLDLFKALGIGSGGFGPVFESGFIEILRLVVNGYEDNVRLSYEGISELPHRIASQVINGRSIRERTIHVQVEQIDREEDKINIKIKGGKVEVYDRVLVTSGFANIEMRHLLTSSNAFFHADVSHAIGNSHMTGASKLFLLTNEKFWLQHHLPSCILTTGVAKAVYCLDYDPRDPSGKGLVLISYTWEDDSHKLLAVPDKRERFASLQRDIGRAFPDFAKHLTPADGNYDDNIVQHDWLTDPHAGGAFKLNRRGNDVYSERLFFQPFDVMHPADDKGLYLAGCSCSFTGGWVDGAIQTACNATCAIIYGSGGTLKEGNPLAHAWKRYRYQA